MAEAKGYSPSHPAIAEAIVLNHGVDHAKLAADLGIARSTLSNWKRQHPELKKAIDDAMAERDADAMLNYEASLKREATGYWIPYKITTKGLNADGELVVTKEETGRKWMRPNPAVLIFTLCNRDPERWKQQNQVEHVGAEGGAIEITVTKCYERKDSPSGEVQSQVEL